MLCTSGFVYDVVFTQWSGWAKSETTRIVCLSSLHGGGIGAKSTESDGMLLSVQFNNKNSSGDEIANVNLLTTISHTRRPTSKYRKRDKPTSFNKLDDR